VRGKKLRFMKVTKHYFGSLKGLHTNVIGFIITKRCNISHLRTCIISIPKYNYLSPLHTRNVHVINNDIITVKIGYTQRDSSNQIVDFAKLELDCVIVERY
jgi:hypothetical protein